MSNRRGSITVGVDIGTTSVKALAVDEKGEVVARSRVPHRVLASEPDQLRHDARRAWRTGPQKAYAQLSAELAASGNGDIAGLAVAAMVPSLTAVNGGGVPTLPGLLYGDLEGRPAPAPAPAPTPGADVAEVADPGPSMPDAEGFLRWARHWRPRPRATGRARRWPPTRSPEYRP